MPYLLSTLDTVAWRYSVPEAVYPEALVPGMREIGTRSTLDLWGAVYPRGGFLHQVDDHKAGAVVAQRAGDIVTRRGQLHVYQPLLANARDGYWPAGALVESDASTGKWQELTPRLSNTCAVFPTVIHGPGAAKGTTPGHCGGHTAAASAGDKRSSAASSSTKDTTMMRPDLINPSTTPPRRSRLVGLAAALALANGLAWAQSGGFQNSGSVIGDEVMYSIGGGNAVSMSGARPACARSAWAWAGTAISICGDMSIGTTIQNQLNGVTNGFQNIMSSGDPERHQCRGLTARRLIIQRADPGLYNLLTNGILQARLDFDRSKLTCRAMGKRMADMAGGQLGWNQLAEGMALRQAVASTDAVSAIEQAESSRGNDGVPWVGGSNAGGAGQPAIKVVGDVTRAGYNLVNGRGVSDRSAIAQASCASLSCQTWSSPEAAVEWATRVLGEQEQRTCETCTKTQTVPGVGLTPLIQEEYDTKLQVLQELIAGSRNTTFEDLREAGSVSLPITRGVIEALTRRTRPRHSGSAPGLGGGAFQRAGEGVAPATHHADRQEEPNVAANQLAVDAVNHESDTLDREILNLKTELELRRELANNSPMAIIQRHGARASGSRGIYEGDPVPDRIDRLQKGNPGEHTMSPVWLRPRWLLNRRVARALLWTLLLIALAVAANIAGIYLVGSIADWEQWLADAAGYFLLWRLCLYGATAYGWGVDAPPPAGARIWCRGRASAAPCRSPPASSQSPYWQTSLLMRAA